MNNLAGNELGARHEIWRLSNVLGAAVLMPVVEKFSQEFPPLEPALQGTGNVI